MKKFIENKLHNYSSDFPEVEDSVKSLCLKKPKDFTRKLIPSLDKMMFRTEREVLFRKLFDSSTAYDLYNIITIYAKKFDIGKQLYLEQTAGKMMT